MKILKKFNRGTIVFFAVMLCVLVSTAAVSADKNDDIREIRQILESFKTDLFSENAESAISGYFYGDYGTEPLEDIYAGIYNEKGESDAIESIETFMTDGDFFWYGDDVYVRCMFSLFTAQGQGHCTITFGFREIDGEMKIVFWRTDSSYFGKEWY